MTTSPRPCKFARTTDPAEWDGRPSRAVAEALAGQVHASAVQRHRNGSCSCGPVLDSQSHLTVSTPDVDSGQFTDEPAPTVRMSLDPDGVEFSGVPSEGKLTNWDHIFEKFDLDPAEFEIVDDTVRASAYQQSKRLENGDRDTTTLFSYRARFRKRRDEETIDLPALYAAARHATRVPGRNPATRATVVVYADPQVGKTGRRGGTAELIARSTRVRDKLSEALTERAPHQILLADAGDGIEGFESGGNPMFTNDLSLAGQLDTYGTELFEFINTCHAHAPVHVMGVPSNHAAWRNGKQNLGRPADDLGLFVHRQVAKITNASGMDVSWSTPEDYDESVAADVLGTRVALVHGNQFPPGKGVDWWQKQTFGAGATSNADVLVHGHYHTFSSATAGRNPLSGRSRWCLGAPTLDNGSDWFRQTAGWDSDPGLLIFDVTEDGFDLSSLTILPA